MSTTATTALMSQADMLARIAQLEGDNTVLEAAAKAKAPRIAFKVAAKGGVSVLGLQRFPVTLYANQWGEILDRADELRAFIAENSAQLKTKD